MLKLSSNFINVFLLRPYQEENDAASTPVLLYILPSSHVKLAQERRQFDSILDSPNIQNPTRENWELLQSDLHMHSEDQLTDKISLYPQSPNPDVQSFQPPPRLSGLPMLFSRMGCQTSMQYMKNAGV